MSSNYTEEWKVFEEAKLFDPKQPMHNKVNHARTQRALFGCNCNDQPDNVMQWVSPDDLMKGDKET